MMIRALLIVSALACMAHPLPAQEFTRMHVGATPDGVVLSVDSASVERTGDAIYFASLVYDYTPPAAQQSGFDREVQMQEMDCARSRFRGRVTLLFRRGLLGFPGEVAGQHRWKPVDDADLPVFRAACERLQRSFAAAPPATPAATDPDTTPELLDPRAAIRSLGRAYPPLLRAAGVTGLVILRVRVAADGSVDPEGVHVVWSSADLFGAAAVRFAQGLRYRPATRDGNPVPVWTTLPVSFMLRPNGATPP